ncbi:hypothetical protein [Acinetobacter pittii]|uniref:hypothetical protein n=1 Tax=Acinetobacter pittii TaxID=48296 RepID=UPI003A896EF3
MDNDLNKFLTGIQLIAQKVHDFLNREEVKIIANKAISGMQQLGEFIHNFYTYSQYQKKMYIEMSQFGWFPSYLTFKTPVLEGETADNYMDRCLSENLVDIEELLINSYPHRKHIFEEAFKLYGEERFVAAIPLFLSQLDGLSVEYGLSPFFTRTKLAGSEKNKLSADEQLKLDKFPIYLKVALERNLLGKSQEIISYYEEVINNACKSFIGDQTKNLDMTNPINRLNRHGILHGHVEFLEYADRINCLKIISLILFVDHILSLIGNLDDRKMIDSTSLKK